MLYRFAEFELDLDQYELRRNGEPVELQPKVIEVLRYLLEHSDRMVPREELLDRLWPEVAVGEAVLTRAVSAARRALGEQEREEEIIRTIRGRGYRISIPVEGVASEPEEEPEAFDEAAPASAIRP